MRKIVGIRIIVCGIFLLSAWLSWEFKCDKKRSYKAKKEQQEILRKRRDKLKREISILEENNSTILALNEKKWEKPEGRIIASECIETLGRSFNFLNYTFEPERILKHDNGNLYRMTQIVIHIECQLDTEVYNFIENLLKKFPGVLFLSEIYLSLSEDGSSPYIQSKLVFEWFSMGGRNEIL